MRTDSRHPDEAAATAIVGQTLQVHKAEHISLAAARTLLGSVADVVAKWRAEPPAEPVGGVLAPYFDRVLLEHRAGLVSQTSAARRLMQAVHAVADGDVTALDALRAPAE